MEYSISTFEKLIDTCKNENKQIFEIMQEKEAYDFETTIEQVRNKTYKNIEAMKNAIKQGLNSNEKSFSGLCGDDCEKLLNKFNNKKSLFGELFEKITTYALATMDENLRMK